MKTKRAKLFAALVCALILSLSSLTAAFAAGPIQGNEDNPAQASIAKILQMPVGTNTPGAKFVFNVDAKTADAPAIGPIEITYTAGDYNASNGTVNGNTFSFRKESGDIFDGINFSHAGTYVYEITEDKDASYKSADPNHEKLTYSGAKYTVTVLVKNNKAGTGVYIDTIAAVITTPDNGGQTANEKVDPTPDASNMIFTNTFVKTNGPTDPEDPDPEDPAHATLSVSKTVTGDIGDKTRYFVFGLTVTAPSLIPANEIPAFYRAYVVDASGVVSAADLKDAAKNNVPAGSVDSDDGGAYIEVATSGTTTINLKHGQKLVFVDTPVGTRYTVAETAVAGYVTTIEIVYNSGTPVTLTNTTATSERLIGEKTNSAAYDNKLDSSPITGLSINDLPFAGMIALAIAAVAFFILAKTRKARKSNSHN